MSRRIVMAIFAAAFCIAAIAADFISNLDIDSHWKMILSYSLLCVCIYSAWVVSAEEKHEDREHWEDEE